MIKFNIIVVGQDKDKWVSEAIAHFEKLLSKSAEIKWTVVSKSAKSNSLSSNEIKIQEARDIKKYLENGTIIALIDKGTQYDSINFAKKLEKILARSSGEIKFVIGGPYGLDKSIIESADEVLSLSSLTFSHQIVRLVLLEQLYRALSILRGSDYHK